MTIDKSGRTSAGILLWRRREGRLEVLLAHQGGPFWVNKDALEDRPVPGVLVATAVSSEAMSRRLGGSRCSRGV